MPPKKQIAIRINENLLSAVDTLALEEVRDRTSMIEYILTTYIREHRPELLDITDAP